MRVAWMGAYQLWYAAQGGPDVPGSRADAGRRVIMAHDVG